MAVVGIPVAFLMIWGTKYVVGGFDGLLWPARFVAFGLGMVIYAAGVGYYFNEGLSAKTLISLLLSNNIAKYESNHFLSICISPYKYCPTTKKKTHDNAAQKILNFFV